MKCVSNVSVNYSIAQALGNIKKKLNISLKVKLKCTGNISRN